MKNAQLVIIVAAFLAMSVQAADTNPAHDDPVPTGLAAPMLDIPAAAEAAVETVERFSRALASGQLEAAARELDAKVVILESGGAERSAEEYLGGHAREDAQFLKGAQQQLLHRTARTDGNLAWVASESELRVQLDGKPRTFLSTETMVLERSSNDWKIVHIHWSSREKKP